MYLRDTIRVFFHSIYRSLSNQIALSLNDVLLDAASKTCHDQETLIDVGHDVHNGSLQRVCVIVKSLVSLSLNDAPDDVPGPEY